MSKRLSILLYVVLTVSTYCWTQGAASQGNFEVEVLDANARFYEVLVSGNPEGMDALWTKRAPVAVIHPAWPAIDGRAAVLESWHRVVMAPPDIQVVEPRVHVIGEMAFVTCYELVNSHTTLAATNVFVREEGVWKIVHHHANSTQYIEKPGAST